ncbi:hypothetical protein B296_00048925 [Ensete ventricosum]|uniref:Uncharacterized protein n=1 Tax=Ensete ventricosum TaxID=4639 RepID=A0A426YKE2_ENSVE|nr:hypothetical protein B296_00048925 [Ensete ventricosum]
MMGLNKTTVRLRYLINWLVTSLLQLRLVDPAGGNDLPLVRIYGPKIKYQRGAAVAFNVKDGSGAIIKAATVQKLAEKNGICLGIGVLTNSRRRDSKNAVIRVEVVTASLGFLTNFEDVYRIATEGTLRELTARSRADRQVRGPKERRCRRRRGPETDAGRRRGTGGGDRGDEDLEAASIDLEIDPRHAIRSNRREIVCEHCGTMRRAFRVLEGAERTKAERGQWRRKPGCFKDLRL